MCHAAETLHESESQNKDLSRSVQELSSIRIQITNERDQALGELGDAREGLRDLQGRLDASTSALNALKADFDNRLREKEDELESIRSVAGFCSRFVCTYVAICILHLLRINMS